MAAPKTASSGVETGTHTARTAAAAYLEGLHVELAGAKQRGAENVKDIETEIARVIKQAKAASVETATSAPTVETA